MDARRGVGNLGDGQRQTNDERRALALAGALGRHTAAMELDKMFYEGQAQAEAAVPSRTRAIRLAESVENKWQHRMRDALSGVAHDDLDVRIDTLQLHL